MPEAPHSTDVLYDILRVLERIETKLDGQETRFRQLEEVPFKAKTRSEKEEEDAVTDPLASSLVTTKVDPSTTSQSEILDEVKHVQKVPYGDWGVDRFIKAIPEAMYNNWDTSVAHLERFYILSDLPPELRRRVGSCWDIPDDNRFPLKIYKSNILKSYLSGGGPGVDTISKAKQRIEREMSQLCDFDESLRKHPGNDFVIVDFDALNNSRMYRVGQEAIGSELMVDHKETKGAPWSRLM